MAKAVAAYCMDSEEGCSGFPAVEVVGLGGVGGAGSITTLLIVGPSIGLTVRNLSNSCSLNNLIICVLMSFTSGVRGFSSDKIPKEFKILEL